MASAYKSATRTGDEYDLDSDDEIMTPPTEETSADEDEETATSDEEVHTTTKLDQLPVELRNRILMLTSRGVSHRHRHLLNDLSALLPHTYKDTKLDTKSSNSYNAALNGLAELHSCNYIFFLEARKQGQDLYLWLAKAPNGPTIKFSVGNVHTMAELGFEGNCLRGGRGMVVFDKSFDESMEGYEHKTLIREMLKGVFCVPSKGIRGMKPFIDRIVGVYGLDGKIWLRVYEIRETEKDKDGTERVDVTLVEIGPRLVLTPIVILEGSFGGPVIYENKMFVSGNQLRSEARLKKASKYVRKRDAVEERLIKKKSLGLESGVKRKRTGLEDAELFG